MIKSLDTKVKTSLDKKVKTPADGIFTDRMLDLGTLTYVDSKVIGKIRDAFSATSVRLSEEKQHLAEWGDSTSIAPSGGLVLGMPQQDTRPHVPLRHDHVPCDSEDFFRHDSASVPADVTRDTPAMEPDVPHLRARPSEMDRGVTATVLAELEESHSRLAADHNASIDSQSLDGPEDSSPCEQSYVLPIQALPSHVSPDNIDHVVELFNSSFGNDLLRHSMWDLSCPFCRWRLHRRSTLPFARLGAPRKYGDDAEKKAGRAKQRKAARCRGIQRKKEAFWTKVKTDDCFRVLKRDQTSRADHRLDCCCLLSPLQDDHFGQNRHCCSRQTAPPS